MAYYSMRRLRETFREHLRAHPQQLACFGKYQFQAEGWLKAEWVRRSLPTASTGSS